MGSFRSQPGVRDSGERSLIAPHILVKLGMVTLSHKQFILALWACILIRKMIHFQKNSALPRAMGLRRCLILKDFENFPGKGFFQEVQNYLSPGVVFDQTNDIFGNYIENRLASLKSCSELSIPSSHASRAPFKVKNS